MALPRRDQYGGCLIGQCLGDALGFPVEGYPPEICRQYIDEVLQVPDSLPGRDPFGFGQYTDDSQLARELIQSYVECRRFDPADYAQRIASIFRENRIVGRGRATEAAANRLIKGLAWDRAGTPPPSAGNGSAMRAAPIGLMFFDDTDALCQAAHDQGRITHIDRRCSAGAVAIAGAVALALNGEPIDPETFLLWLSQWVASVELSLTPKKPDFDMGALKRNEIPPAVYRQKLMEIIGGDYQAPGPVDAKQDHDESFMPQSGDNLPDQADNTPRTLASYILNLTEWLPLGEEDAAWQISKAGLGDADTGGWQGISPFVISSVLWSLYSFLKTPTDYVATIRCAIAVGGDVDTTAAMAGAISGAYLGLDAIPVQFARHLNDQGTWQYNELVELAWQCYDVTFSQY